MVAVLLLHGRREPEFVAKQPTATKRAVRAILKADRICAVEPARAARAFLARGLRTRED